MVARDGIGIIVGGFAAFLISLGLWYFFPSAVAQAVTILLGLFAVFNLYFFRDPDREPPAPTQHPPFTAQPAQFPTSTHTERHHKNPTIKDLLGKN